MACSSRLGRGGAPQVRERADGVVEEHHAEARDDHVEALVVERMGLRVGAEELRRRALELGALFRECDHRLRDVDADGGGALRSEPPRDGERRAARAAADVEHALRLVLGDGVDEQVFEWLEQPVERLLRFDPAASGAAVPKGDLFCIGLLSGVHGGSPLVAGSNP